jgi:hypothetical protein
VGKISLLLACMAIATGARLAQGPGEPDPEISVWPAECALSSWSALRDWESIYKAHHTDVDPDFATYYSDVFARVTCEELESNIKIRFLPDELRLIGGPVTYQIHKGTYEVVSREFER